MHELLTREVWPHEHAEESSPYPALNRVLGGTDPTAPMRRAHAEIAVQVRPPGVRPLGKAFMEPVHFPVAHIRAWPRA